MTHPAEACGAVRVETPVGAYFLRQTPDSSPATWLRWRR